MSQILSLYNLKVENDTVCTIGNFDGIHRGHQQILNILREESQRLGISSVVVTFYPHPRKVLSPQSFKCSIVNLETKVYLLKQSSVDYILIVDFNEKFYSKTAKEFMDFLKERLRCRVLIVGKDWKFGRNKEGDVEFAREYGGQIGIEVKSIEDVVLEDERISSTKIRSLLAEGKVREVRELLGRNYFLRERVVRGNQIGRSIGFPTINLKPGEDLCLKKGVYASFIQIKGKVYSAVINYGYRPTVDGKNLFMEAHVIESFKHEPSQNSFVNVYFWEFIREELKFESVEKLKEQIEMDVVKSREVLSYADYPV